MRHSRSVCALFALLLLTACAGSQYFGMGAEYRVPDGSTILLNQDLTIAAGQVATRIRGGSIGDLYTYDGSCRLEMRSIEREARTIAPDVFTVTKTRYEREYFGGIQPGTMYAGMITPEGSRRDRYTTYLYLQSDAQPDVFRLRCQHLQESDWHPRYLRSDQIETLLGEVMTVVPAPDEALAAAP